MISENLRPIRRFEISLKSNFHVKLSAKSPLKICVISTREFTQRNYIYVSKKPAVRDFKFLTRLFKYSREMSVSFLYVPVSFIGSSSFRRTVTMLESTYM